MKLALWFSVLGALTIGLTSCGTSGGGGGGGSAQQEGIGPFDKNGTYHEEWADNPAKWRRPGGSSSVTKTEDVPEIAQNEQPPLNSVPLATGRTPEPKPTIKETSVVAKNTTSKPEPQAVVVKTRPLNKAEAEVVRAKPKPEPEVVKAKPKPKVVAKVKPKPKSTRYVVKQGDSLSAIASKTGTSVSALKSANGISGTLIRPGQSLTIPKR